MTLKQFGLRPTGSDDSGTPLGGFELAACGVLQLGQGVGTEVTQCMTLEPSPEVLHRVQLGGICWQELDLDAPLRWSPRSRAPSDCGAAWHIWFDESTAITPLVTEELKGLPDTYPFGL